MRTIRIMKSLIVMLILATVLLAACGSNQAVTERTGAETTSAKSEETTEKTAAEGTASEEADEAAQSKREVLRDTVAQQAAEKRAERGACLSQYYESLPPEQRGPESQRVTAEADARGVTPFDIVGC